MPESLPFSRPALEEYLASIYGIAVEVTKVRKLKSQNSRKDIEEFSYGEPLLVEVQVAGEIDHLVIHTVDNSRPGYEMRASRAEKVLLDYDTSNKLPHNIPCLGVGAFTENGNILPLEKTTELFLVSYYTSGRTFEKDLNKLSQGADLIPEDKIRTLALSDYLVQIHNHKQINPNLYFRRIRDLFAHSKGIYSLTDNYPSGSSIATTSRLKKIEHRLIEWRWRLKDRTNRLSQVHGDYHPGNILFQKTGEFFVLGRSRGEWGEPAEDISAMSIHFIFHSLQRYGALRGIFKVLFEIFWDHYLQKTQDIELASVIQPYYAWRALGLAHPSLYPNLSDETRLFLFNFIDNVLSEEWFDPQSINEYLGVNESFA